MDKNIEFVGITSGAGGTGTSSLCQVLSRLLTKIHNRRILILSFDTISMKMAPFQTLKNSTSLFLLDLLNESSNFEELKQIYLEEDDFNVSYLCNNIFINPLSSICSDELYRILCAISKLSDYDLVILDLPFTNMECINKLSFCETIIFSMGYSNDQIKVNDELYAFIRDLYEKEGIHSKLLKFYSMRDDESFFDGEVDLHGQYAAEVREFASRVFA